MMRFLLSLILVLGVAGIAAAQSVPATPPASAATPVPAAASAPSYSATVPVAGTSDAQRNTAIRVALAVVLQRVSPGFVASDDELAQASGYVRDFHYRRAASSSGLDLQVDFDPGAIGRLIAARRQNATSTVSNVAASGAPASAGTAMTPPVAPPGQLDLWVEGIDNSHAFASLLSTLRGDDDLHGVTPVVANGNGVLLQLDSDASLTRVLAGLTGPGRHLTPAAQPHPGAAASLRWVP